MMDRSSLRAIGSVVVLGAMLSRPAAADMSGHWLHVGDPSGLMVSHLEELVIPDAPNATGEAGFEIRVHRLEGRMVPECLDGPASPDACSAMVATDRGQLVFDRTGGRLDIVTAETLAEPFSHPVDEAAWNLLGLARGKTWRLVAKDNVLTVEREIAPGDLLGGGQPRSVSKPYYRVPDGFAGNLLVVAADLGTGPVVAAGCVVQALADRPMTLAEVARHIGLGAPVIRQIRGLQAAQAAMPRNLARGVMENTVLPFLQQAGDTTAPIVAAEGFSAEGWEAAVGLARFHSQNPAAGTVLFPEALPFAEEIGACRDRLLQ